MKVKSLAITTGVIAASVLMFGIGTANAEVIPVEPDCLNGWYVNDDEGGSEDNQGDRRPTSTEEGLVFKDNQLVHHETDIPLTDLEPGSYVAEPDPSLDSFFSVEIINSDGTGYATLRLDGDGWFIGGPQPGTYDQHETDPANFIGKMSNWGEIKDDSKVVSFGVGYVNTPNDGTETTVSSVTFASEKYDLKCEPSEEPSDDPSEEPSVTPSESASATESSSAPPVSTGGNLPITGAKLISVGLAGLGMVTVGMIGILWSRRNRDDLMEDVTE